MYITIIFILFSTVISTPPACFISCTSEIGRTCPRGLIDLTCLCSKEDDIVACLVDICPFGTFLSARDHYIGTCLEHGKPTITNPIPPHAIWPPSRDSESGKQHPDESIPDEQPGQEEQQPSQSSSSVSAPGSTQDEQPPPPQQQTQDTTLRTHTTKTVNRARNTATLPANGIVTNHPGLNNTNNELNEGLEHSDSEDDFYDPNSVCEWEETDALDANGEFIIIRRPINVPKRYRNPANVGNTRRVIIKRPVPYYSHQNIEDLTSLHKIQLVKKIKTPKFNNQNNNDVPHSYLKSLTSSEMTPKKPPYKVTTSSYNQKKKTKVNRKSL